MSLERVSPSEAGLDGDVLLRFVERLGELNAHSFMVVRHSKVVAEGWWSPFQPDYRHSIFSLTKSFTSTAIGFAVEEGLLSIHDRVVSFFPDKLTNQPCAYMAKLTVRDMLTMSTGHIAEPPRWEGAARFEEDRKADEDNVYKFLTSYIQKEPGSYFMYNTPGTFMCGAILKAVTGQSVFEYLKPRLFEPLGITNYHSEVNAEGLNPAGFGGHLCTEDMAKFGVFLLNKGAWNGKQLISAKWIEEATSRHVDNSHHPSGFLDWTKGYGYQFWRCSPPGVFRGDGLFGQFCIVMPEQDTVVAITSGSSEMHKMLEALWETVLPELNKKPEAGKIGDTVAKRFTQLQIPLPSGGSGSHTDASPYSGRVYELASNSIRVSKISVTDSVSEGALTFWRGDKKATAKIGYGKWLESTTGSDDDGVADLFSEVALAGAWEGNDTLHLKMIFTRTPYTDTWTLRFDEKGVVFDYRRDPIRDQPFVTRLMGREV